MWLSGNDGLRSGIEECLLPAIDSLIRNQPGLYIVWKEHFLITPC